MRIAKLLAAVVLVTLVAQSAAARSAKDEQPPEFAGLASATTCVPGPIEGGQGRYTLRWRRATDNVTRSKNIAYDLYQAAAPGGEDFATPTYTTRRGATSFVTPPLPGDMAVYFVVRARDTAGNRDRNKVEREGQNPCV